MKKFYQREWHGISFKDIEPFSTKLPSKFFYSKFYEKLFVKYKGFEELDEVWTEYKTKVAKKINSYLKSDRDILSIGSGIGVVEDTLTKLNPDLRITAIEPSENASLWIRDNPNISVVDGYFPECLGRNCQFDFVYANNIDYVFDDREYEAFLRSVVDYGLSEILIITTANYNTWTCLKLVVRQIIGAMGLISKPDHGQFWGYLRTKQEHRKALLKVGFVNVNFEKLGSDTLFIRGVV